MPPVTGNVVVVVDNSQGFVPGMTIAVERAGTYQVVDAGTLNRLTIQNLNNQNNALPGTTIPPGNLTTTSLPGPKGDKGDQGIQGLAATVDVGATVTSPAGQNASVVNVGTQSQAVFNFTIPRGPVGPQGPQGAPGQAYNNTTTAAFTAADAPTVQTLSLQSTTGLFSGVVLDINPIGYYQIQNVISGTQVNVVNTETPGNSAAGTVSPSGSAVLGTGPQGPPGIPASIAAGNTTTLAPGNAAVVTQRGTPTAAIFDFAIPQGAVGTAGAPGAQGPPGTAGADGVTPTLNAGNTSTLSPGQPAAVTQRGTPTAVIFDFAIPQGAVGATGPAGTTGPQGATGPTGTAATVAAGTTSTGLPGTNAAVTNSGSSSAAVFNFTIPRGDVGAQGPIGNTGPTGATGAQGPKGDLGNEDVGSIKAWPAAAAPASWMLADGSAISRTLYPGLFSVIGTSYGAGDGSTTFNLPDMRGRFVLGFGQGAGLTNRVLAATGGEENHLLSAAEMPAHTHPNIANVGNVTAASGSGVYAWNGVAMTTTGATGGGAVHNNMPPFLVITYIIKVSLTGGATAQAPIADATQDGLLRKVSGLSTDFVDGTNNCHPLGKGPTSHYYDYDDFIGGLATVAPTTSKLFNLGTNAGAGSVAQGYTADMGDGRHGVIQLSGGSVAQNWGRAFMGGGFYLRASTVTFRMIVNPFNAGATAAAQHLVGLSSSPGPVVAITNYYIIFYLIRASSPNWFYQVRNLSAFTSADTGVVATINTWFDLKLVANATSVKFYINGVQVGSTITTNIPVGQLLYPYAAHNSATDTTLSYLMADWAEIDIDTGIAGRFSKAQI